jgi:hypothetical protein
MVITKTNRVAGRQIGKTKADDQQYDHRRKTQNQSIEKGPVVKVVTIASDSGAMPQNMGIFPKKISCSTYGHQCTEHINMAEIKIFFPRRGGYISLRGARVVLYGKGYPSTFLANTIRF